MTESNLVSDGALLMLIGMGTVFVFLSILVFFTSMLQRVIGTEKSQSAVSLVPATQQDEIVAITAAVHAYRSKFTKSQITKE